MQIEIISFTQNGQKLAAKLQYILEEAPLQRQVTVRDGRNLEMSLRNWCQYAFEHAQVLIFIGAAGIAVRTIAPFVKDKFSDPAVLVIDEAGSFVIPILSGHMGGGNEFAVYAAQQLCAIPVITTATDINGVFAVDEFARKNHLTVADRKWAKVVSAAILQGEKVGFCCEGQVRGKLPGQLTNQDTELKIMVGIHKLNQLHPKTVALGIGCKKGKTCQEIKGFAEHYLDKLNIAKESILCVSTINIKQEEPGLRSFCEQYQLPLWVFSPEELAQVPGTFRESQFVKGVTGVGNVCERAAVMALWKEACGEVENFSQKHISLIQEKVSQNGMTLAIAQKEWSVTFE